MDLISRKKTLQQMRKRSTKGKLIPFSCVVCKMNFATSEGGGRLHVKKAIVYHQKHVAKPKIKDRTRIPNHDENGTINLLLIPSNEIRTIHVRLIEKFNGMIVYD
jgi:hydroxyacyl-ACP dehydratase HTD2-like protein with hotdog domain